MSSPSRSARPTVDAPTAADDDDACAVCLEPWASAGPHRVAALKACGHLFGLKCIQTVVDTTKRCPLCSAPATRDDALPLFVGARLVAADGTAAAETERMVAAEAAARAAAEAALVKARATVADLRRRVARLTKDKARLVALLDSVRKDGGGGGAGVAASDAPVDSRGRPLESGGERAAQRARRDLPPPSFSHRLTIPLPVATALDACAAAGVAVAGCAPCGASTAALLRRCSLLAPSLAPPVALPLTSVREVVLAGPHIALAVGRGAAAGVAGAIVDARCGTVAATLATTPFPALCGVWVGGGPAASTSIVLGLTSGGLAHYDTRRPGAPLATAPPPGGAACLAPRPVHTLTTAPGNRLLAVTAAGGTLWQEAGGVWEPAAVAGLATEESCFGGACAAGVAALAMRAAPAAPPTLALWSLTDDTPACLGVTAPAPTPTGPRTLATVEGGGSDDRPPLVVVGAGDALAAWPLARSAVGAPPVMLTRVPGGDLVAMAGAGGGVLVAATAGCVSVVRRG